MDRIGVDSAELVVQLAWDDMHCWVMGVTVLVTALVVGWKYGNGDAGVGRSMMTWLWLDTAWL